MHRYTLLVLLILGAARPARGNEWAEGLFHQRSVDFGTVPKGTVLEYSFPIVNNTKKTFQIASVRVSTGALSARAKQATLTPGQQTVIIARMDTNRFVKERTHTIFVTFDEPRFEEVRLSVKVNSRDDVMFSPDNLDFKRIKRGTTATAHMTMAFFAKPKILVTEAKSESKFIQPKLQELRREGGEVVYLISAMLRSDLPEGKWYTDIWLKTNDEAMPRIRVPVTVEVEAPLLDVKINGPKEALLRALTGLDPEPTAVAWTTAIRK
jgi:hypothetical protein